MNTRRSWRARLAGAIAALVVLAPASGQAALTSVEREASARASELMRALRDVAGLPGVSAAVAMDGRVVWSAGVGFADVEQSVPARADTVYRLASISKAVTGVAVARLLEEGRVDLDAPIARYLPDYPTASDRITLRMLLAHTSGIRGYTPEERDDLTPRRRERVEDALAMFAADPLVHEPGAGFTYTTLGYVVVRAIVERVTGARFMDYVAAAVLRPAGMLSTGPDDNLALVPGRAAFYQTTGDGRESLNAPYIDTSYKVAGGGMVGTAPDLCRLGLALAEGRLIGSEARATLWSPTPTSDGLVHRYGMGWGLANDARGVFYAVQIGGQIGTGSAVLIYPEEGVAASVMTNRASGPVGRAEVVALAQVFKDAAAGVSAASASVPSGVWTVELEDGSLAWRGVMTLHAALAGPLGEIHVVSATDEHDRRRFVIAAATASRSGGVRVFTVHERWGVFPFDLEFSNNGAVRGVLDRAEDRPWTLTAEPWR